METISGHNFVLVLTLFSLFSKNMVGEAATPAPPCPSVVGPQGDKGEVGESGVCDASSCPTSGLKTNYVRFGRNECPSGAELVYEGIVGGRHHNQGGGGSNYLCMQLQVTYQAAVSAAADVNRALLYATTYAFDTVNDPLGRSSHSGTPVPCALCLASRATSAMIPAKKDCPSGWTKEYSGYLMAEWTNSIDTRHASEYICVDKDMEIVGSSVIPNWASVMYMTEMLCDNGLPCGAGQYVANNELACVVCTI